MTSIKLIATSAAILVIVLVIWFLFFSTGWTPPVGTGAEV